MLDHRKCGDEDYFFNKLTTSLTVNILLRETKTLFPKGTSDLPHCLLSASKEKLHSYFFFSLDFLFDIINQKHNKV